MPSVAAAAPHTDAVVAALEGADILVDRGQAPDGAGWQGEPGYSQFRAYVVLYPSPGVPDGSIAEPTEYLGYSCQATCIAATQVGAERLADAVKALFVNQLLDVAGRSSYRGQLLLDRPVSRDDAVTPPEHYAVLQLGWITQAT